MRIGIDLGGTKIEVLALDTQGNECYRKRVATPRTYQGTLNQIEELVKHVELQLDCKAHVGVGIPGTVSPFSGLVKNANSTWLNGQPLDKDLSKLLDRDVKVANDANCFAVSEAVDGAAKGQEFVFGVILGTGCGAGIALNGKVHQGSNGLGGEWGHNPLPWMFPQEFRSTECFCGKHDCIESYVSGTGFENDYAKQSGVRLAASDIWLQAQQEEFIAAKCVHLYLDRLARSLAHVINLLDPDIIVLGGGMSNADAIYPALPLILPLYVLGGECQTPVVKNLHGDASGVRGAAWL